jgi:hypothetical protein
MKSLEKKEILRLNCPGYGEDATFSVGSARPLDDYKVIVVNPLSILHLFGAEAKTLEEIEAALSQGLTSLCLPNSDSFKLLADVVALRTEEIVRFLEKGGLLVYYLCRPFVVQGQSVSLDNYLWLLSLAPDQPGETNVRHMSSVSQGRKIELCERASKSEFAQYFKQDNLEWNTLIRSEFLTDGYTALAMAAANKCISAELYAGDNGGKIIFLPAPYLPEFDDTLLECVKLWYQDHKSHSAEAISLAADPALHKETITSDTIEPIVAGTPIEQEADQDITAENVALPKMLSAEEIEEYKKKVLQAIETPEKQAEKFQREKALKSTAEIGEAFEDISKQLDQEAKEQGINLGISSAAESLVKALEKSASSGNSDEELPLSAGHQVSAWCRIYTLPGLDVLYKEKDSLIAQIETEQARVNAIQECLAKIEDLKNHLLGSSGDHLKDACTRALKRMGWTVSQSTMCKQELWLALNDQTEAIARIVESDAQPERIHLAQLAESVISFWEKHEREPKAVLIASTWRGKSFDERKDADFPDTMIDFAKKKNIGLLTTHQLLCNYRDLELTKASAEDIRTAILTTSGALPAPAELVKTD